MKFFNNFKKYFSEKLSLSDQIYIFGQLATLTNSGLTLHESLATLADESHSKKLTGFFKNTAEEIVRGETLSGFMDKKYTWKPMAIALVRVGESSGSLAGSFVGIAKELSRGREIRRKIIGALIYPLCVAIFAIILIVGIVSFIFPKIIPVLQSIKGDLPFSTRTIIFLTDFLKNFGLLSVFIILIIVTLSVLAVKKFPTARIFLEKIFLKLPLFGRLYQAFFVSHILKSVGTLISSETNLVEALEITISAVPSGLYRRALENAKEKISHGSQLSLALSTETGLFPKISLNLLSIGERTGSLPAVCEQIANIYNGQFESGIETASKMIEPALMIALGLSVGFIAISIITPIYEITSNVRR